VWPAFNIVMAGLVPAISGQFRHASDGGTTSFFRAHGVKLATVSGSGRLPEFVARPRKAHGVEYSSWGLIEPKGALTMARRTTPPTASDDQARALLERYHCPLPFHAVRARLLGNIASPAMQGSPIRMLEALWGGELPTFDSIDEANELIGALLMGLWNRLTRHQQRSAPFRLTPIEVPATPEGMAALARLRREEVEGFIKGVFCDKDGIDLPERAHKALVTLGEIRAMLVGVQVLAEDPTKPATPDDIAVTIGQFQELTRIAEHEIHEAVLSCARVRQQMLAGLPARRPVLH
jgi:hypothetical protein